VSLTRRSAAALVAACVALSGCDDGAIDLLPRDSVLPAVVGELGADTGPRCAPSPPAKPAKGMMGPVMMAPPVMVPVPAMPGDPDACADAGPCPMPACSDDSDDAGDDASLADGPPVTP
jgi:hypothetical protein